MTLLTKLGTYCPPPPPDELCIIYRHVAAPNYRNSTEHVPLMHHKRATVSHKPDWRRGGTQRVNGNQCTKFNIIYLYLKQNTRAGFNTHFSEFHKFIIIMTYSSQQEQSSYWGTGPDSNTVRFWTPSAPDIQTPSVQHGGLQLRLGTAKIPLLYTKYATRKQELFS
jgi:hypothetical protein